MVNNTGIIEAQTLNDVTGKVILFAHGGTANISGTVDARGGFVETSGDKVKINEGTLIKADKWLIDPVDFTISASGGDISGTTLSSNLDTASVTIESSSGSTGTAGNINVNDAITWSANNTLTLSAYNNINVNENMTHTGTSAGGIIFLYGQGTADGGTSTYTLASGKTVTSPSLQWRKGSDQASTRYAIVDGDVFLGGKYIEIGISVNEGGQFGTQNTKPSLFFGRQGGLSGIGMIGDADGFGTGENIAIDYFLPGGDWEQYSVAFNGSNQGSSDGAPNPVIELLPLTSDGVMSFKATSSFTDLAIEQVFSLGTNDKYFKNDVTLSNTGSTVLTDTTFIRHFDPDNTKDMGGDYENIQKIESTISSDGAAVVSATSLSGDPYEIASGSQSKIIYYSTDSRAIVGFDASFPDSVWPFWDTDVAAMVAEASLLHKGDTVTEDGSIGIIFQVGSLAAGASTNFSYLTSLDNRDMSTILSELNVASGGSSTPSTPSTPPAEPEQQQVVNNIVTTIVNSTTITPPAPIVVAPLAPQPQQLQTQAQNNTLLQIIMPQSSTNGGSFGLVGSTDGSSSVQTVTMEQLQSAAMAQGMGEIRVPLANNSMVELVNGGVNLPSGVSQEFYVVDNNTNQEKKN
jgi:hypothetical protein